MLHGDALLRRGDPRAAVDDDSGLLALSYPRRLFDRPVEGADRPDSRGERAHQHDRASGLPPSASRARGLHRVAELPRGAAGQPFRLDGASDRHRRVVAEQAADVSRSGRYIVAGGGTGQRAGARGVRGARRRERRRTQSADGRERSDDVRTALRAVCGVRPLRDRRERRRAALDVRPVPAGRHGLPHPADSGRDAGVAVPAAPIDLRVGSMGLAGRARRRLWGTGAVVDRVQLQSAVWRAER